MSVRIADIVKKDFTGVSKWFSWKSLDFQGVAFEVELSPIVPNEFREIAKRNTQKVFNRRLRTHIEETDGQAVADEIIERSVKNWRGLRIAHIKAVTPLNAANVPDEATIEFSAENLKEIVNVIPEFGAWIIETVTALKNFDKSAPSDESELKNS